ncbi:T6SS phospholipase effector Tle1-like catalytic domain-containing protein [Vibrio hepatarius]|uniref:T6SS Phospholipase effector Tle1-like catalytic domain-containing protein n=1 Tax=Vibrio hepatarius TaxID=171383 RepID=A0A0M0HZ95_9VIBR|nr:DUF2235 domain-containing protein [Vibrio hepatarius]KOO07404.1 hypothetical protein AKJ31_10940 [Vibrio hepatarius]NOI14261.1 DUF2235 domain-containing protein [Vibrio hepatarius]
MRALGVDSHCIVCEKYTHWIEIVVRDEHNQAFPDISGTLIDGSGAEYPVTVGEAPILLTDLAPGRVELKLEVTSWLEETEKRTPFEGSDCPVDLWLTDNPLGHESKERTRHDLTLGDFITAEEGKDLPKRHQAQQLGAAKLVTDNSHLVTIQGCRYITLRLGMFFDGTANNTYSAKWGKQQLEARYNSWKASYQASKSILESRGEAVNEVPATELIDSCFDFGDVTGSAANELTNIQKLYDLYATNTFDDSKSVFHHAQYVTGIGTGNSTDIAPADEDEIPGQAFGLGKYGVVAKVETGIAQVCKELDDIILSIEEQLPIDGFSKLEFDVFGFSRGAAAARHFVNVVLDGEKSLFAERFIESSNYRNIAFTRNFDWSDNKNCEVSFVGVFDTVAAIMNPLAFDVSLHNDDNDPVRLWLDPKRVRKAVHLVAHENTEYRVNFTLNKLNRASHFDELVLPGAHSDLGGGYHSRVAYPQNDYWLPLLENQRIRKVWDRDLPTFGKQRRIDVLKQKLDVVKQQELAHGWNENNYLVTEPKITRSGRDKESASMELIYRAYTEGDLSRLYLRVMYGLAEFSGVPLSDMESGRLVWDCTSSTFDAHLNYPVQDKLKDPKSGNDFLFGKLCKQVLELAKNGDKEKIKLLLGSDAQRYNFMNLGLVHHSSDEDLNYGLFKGNASNIVDDHYKRKEHECEKEL